MSYHIHFSLSVACFSFIISVNAGRAGSETVSHFSASNFIRNRDEKRWMKNGNAFRRRWYLGMGQTKREKNETDASESCNLVRSKSRKNSFLIQHIIFQSIFFLLCSVAVRGSGCEQNEERTVEKKIWRALKSVFNTNCYWYDSVFFRNKMTARFFCAGFGSLFHPYLRLMLFFGDGIMSNKKEKPSQTVIGFSEFSHKHTHTPPSSRKEKSFDESKLLSL